MLSTPCVLRFICELLRCSVHPYKACIGFTNPVSFRLPNVPKALSSSFLNTVYCMAHLSFCIEPQVPSSDYFEKTSVYWINSKLPNLKEVFFLIFFNELKNIMKIKFFIKWFKISKVYGGKKTIWRSHWRVKNIWRVWYDWGIWASVFILCHHGVTIQHDIGRETWSAKLWLTYCLNRNVFELEFSVLVCF